MEVEIETVRGVLGARGVVGDVTLKNRRGNLNLSEVEGRCTLTSGLADVIVDNHRGSASIEVSAGDVIFRATEIGTAGLEITTGEGNILCFVPENAAFVLDGFVTLGRVTNGFGIPIEELSGFSKRMHGVSGTSGPPIKLRSERGNIALSPPRMVR